MPLYEYQCQQCGARSETLQKIADPPLTTCEACGGELKRLLSAPAVQFKGAGWYVTDYARKSGGGGAKGEPKADAKGDSGGGESKASGSTGEGKADKGAGATSSAGSGKAD